MKRLGIFLKSVSLEKKPKTSSDISLKKKIIDEKTVFFFASKIITEEYGRRGGSAIVPHRFNEGKLFLSVENALWGEEMRFFQSKLLMCFKDAFGDDIVREIQISHKYGQ